VTYLFEGEIRHKDSLGFDQTIRPGDINWMTAGRGIVHSERTPPDVRARASRLHGLQLWVALPDSHEETEPEFHHHPASTLPERTEGSARLRVLAGAAFGLSSPVKTLSPLFFVEALVPAGAELRLPDEYAERGAYVVEGAVSSGGEHTLQNHLLVFTTGADAVLRAETPSRVVLLGGNSVGPRFLDWNFVSSSKERLERAKLDWKEGRFPKVPGDDELIPLP
jgi:redox-sensitive bicupin YhaK (pirin superfamily)